MDLIERYLQAIRFWLPRGQDDLLAELAEDLRCQMEEAEARLGRPLDRTEVAALLKKVGTPLQVAGRYQAQGPLLDPALAMIYRLVVKIVLLWILLPLILVAAVASALVSSHPVASLWGILGSYATSALMALGCITLVFTLVAGTWTGAAWDPLKLPPLRREGEARRVPRSSSLFELVFGLLFTTWWVEVQRGLPVAWSTLGGVAWSAGPLWAAFQGRWFLPVLLLSLANCAAAGASLARPHWVTFRQAWGAFSNGLMAAICLATLAAHRPSLLEHLGALKAMKAMKALDPRLTGPARQDLLMEQVVALILLAVGVSFLGTALVQGVKLVRSRREPAGNP